MDLYIIISSLLFVFALVGYLPVFDRPYDIPQGLALLCLVFLSLARKFVKEMSFKERATLFVLMPLVAYQSALGFSAALFSLSAAFYLLWNDFSESGRRKIFNTLIAVGVVQSLMVIVGYFLSRDEGLFRRFNSIPVGTVGNPEFVATVVSAAILSLYARRTQIRGSWVLLGVLAAGLLATRSRGSIILTIGIICLPLLRPWMVAVAGVAAIGLLTTYWNLFAGRIQLWWVSLQSLGDHFLTGAGDSQFSSVYFNTNLEIMGRNTWFRETFGGWSSQVSDAHNLVLQWAIEFGLIGLVAAVLFLFYVFRSAFPMVSFEQRLSGYLAVKSLYTVVLTSVQGALLWPLALRPLGVDRVRRKELETVLLAILIGASSVPILKSAIVSRDLFLAHHFMTIELNDIAMGYVADGLRNEPSNTDLLLTKAFIHLKKRECSQSAEEVARAVSIRQDMDTYKRGGLILYECGNFRGALRLLKDLHMVFPEHRTTTIKMAWSYFYLNQNDEARSLAQEVLAIRPRRESHSDYDNLMSAQRLLGILDRREI